MLALLLPICCLAVSTDSELKRKNEGDESGPHAAAGLPLPLTARTAKGNRGRTSNGASTHALSSHALQAQKKALLKTLISKLGKPCSEKCTGEEGVNGKECHAACEQRKMKKLQGFLAKLKTKAHNKLFQKKHSLYSAKQEAREDDAARKKQAAEFFAPKFAKNKPSTRYPSGLVDIFGGISGREIRSDVFENSQELHCDGTDGSAVGPDGRVTGPPIVDPDEAAHLCGMCGGSKVLLWTPLKGQPLPAVSENERRFLQTAPFEEVQEKDYAALVLSLLQPNPLSPADTQLPNRTMMSWSSDGKLACVGYEVPPSAADALHILGMCVSVCVCQHTRMYRPRA